MQNLKKNESENSNKIIDELDLFLNKLVNIPVYRSVQYLYDFLELSCVPLPFSIQRIKEGYVKKKPGGRYREGFCSKIFQRIFMGWSKRWFIITEDGLNLIIIILYKSRYQLCCWTN